MRGPLETVDEERGGWGEWESEWEREWVGLVSYVFELSNTDRVTEGPGVSGRASGLCYCLLLSLFSIKTLSCDRAIPTQRVLLLQCHVGFLAFFFQRVHLLLAGIDYGKLVLKNSIFIYIYIFTQKFHIGWFFFNYY